MASNIADIIKSELVATIESMLSVSAEVVSVDLVEPSQIDDKQCIAVDVEFERSGGSGVWHYYIPTLAATKFEYLMMGGIADLKETIDDETIDGVKEIISTISGSIVTSVNAQGFDDIAGMKFTLGDATLAQCGDVSSSLYQFNLKLNDEAMPLLILFDDEYKPFIEYLTGAAPATATSSSTSENVPASSGNSILSSILDEDSVENLRLLFDIKMRLSVRLGTKVCLLKDVISWDIGEIIELSQMTNEPLDILVNGVVIGQGEAVIVDGKFGVKIKHIGEEKIA